MRISTIRFEASDLNFTTLVLSSGYTRFVSIIIDKSLSLSAQMEVPVYLDFKIDEYPVWPNELAENLCPQGGLVYIGTVSHPRAREFSYDNFATFVQ